MLTRRAFLKGAGVSIALPWLESRRVWGQEAAKNEPPVRLAVLFAGNGFHGKEWFARGDGKAMQLGKVLEPLDKVKEKLVFIRGLYNQHSGKGGIHSAQTGDLLTGAVLEGNGGIRSGVSMDQLVAQKITFTPADKLSAEEKQSTDLVKYAGQPLTTGKQAEAYANDYIALHLAGTNDGKTYSQTSNDARALRAQATTAQQNNAPNAADLDKQATALEAKVQTLFRGETLRGLLLTSYGFSIFGDKAMQASWVAFFAALILFVASIAGFIHAFRTSKSEAFAPVDRTGSPTPLPA